MKIEDSYHYWIENIAEQKFRDTDKWRYSEVIAFAEYYAEKQNQELRELLEEADCPYYSQHTLQSDPEDLEKCGFCKKRYELLKQ